VLGGPFPRALVMVTFPADPGELDVYDVHDQGRALTEIGHAILADHRPKTGTILIPFQRRVPEMKVNFDVTKDSGGGKYFRFEAEYDDLPEPYVWDIASKASAFAKYIETTTPKGGGAKTYKVRFRWGAEAQRGEAEKAGLRYSEMVKCQRAGLRLLDQLLESADMEIASGQRD
jgi:hypothetical protein